MTTLSEFLTSKNIKVTEGNISGINSQRNEICDILKNKNYSYIMEIGFNAGHSSELFLENSNAYVYSFDIGSHFNQYLKYGKQFINQKYPNRHTIVFGDSKISVPRFTKNNNIKFDLIFIDGHHDGKALLQYLETLSPFIHDETIILVDDIRWSDSMFTAWKKLRTDEHFHLTIDLFRCGILMKRSHQQKEDFVVWY